MIEEPKGSARIRMSCGGELDFEWETLTPEKIYTCSKGCAHKGPEVLRAVADRGSKTVLGRLKSFLRLFLPFRSGIAT